MSICMLIAMRVWYNFFHVQSNTPEIDRNIWSKHQPLWFTDNLAAFTMKQMEMPIYTNCYYGHHFSLTIYQHVKTDKVFRQGSFGLHHLRFIITVRPHELHGVGKCHHAYIHLFTDRSTGFFFQWLVPTNSENSIEAPHCWCFVYKMAVFLCVADNMSRHLKLRWQSIAPQVYAT